MDVRPIQLDIYRTAIPMRTFEHAAAARDLAEAVVVRVLLSDGSAGWGETLPRQYVTGETMDTVVRDLVETVWPTCASQMTFGDDGSVEIPVRAGGGRCIGAAVCAFDLATLRRCFPHDDGGPSRAFREVADRPMPRPHIDSRVSGVLGSADPARTGRQLRRMRWFGLRDFKLKLGLGQGVDEENLRVVVGQLGKGLACGKCSLRVDVNGGWDADGTPRRVEALRRFHVTAVEQPIYGSAIELLALARKCSLPLIADESLRTEEDARLFLQERSQLWWNIRLSKNGGFVRCLRLMRLAAEHRIPFVVGCMVGESSILSSAQRLLLQWGPMPRYVEGNYGKFLLTGDLTRRSLRFSYGGRLKPLPPNRYLPAVHPENLRRYGQLVATVRA